VGRHDRAALRAGPNTKGTRTAIESVDESAKYSWVKAPRWRGHAMEVGPLARYILGYAHAKQGNPHGARIKEQIDAALQSVNQDMPKPWAARDDARREAAAADHDRPHARARSKRSTAPR
jgi:Ni,Fe-hydrogenase I large subunit